MRVQAAALVVEEPLLNDETLVPILRYLEATTDLADKPNLLTQPGFKESFDELLEEESVGLYDVINAFDRLVVTRTDPATNAFGSGRHRVDQRRCFRDTSLLGCLRDLVESGRASDLLQFTLAIEELYRKGHTAETLVH
jgi:hypothetical protein